jgi:acyl dehydratase
MEKQIQMVDFGVLIGETFTFSKTVAESDIYLFAGITGDFFANHVNEEYMKKTPFGHRIAHGVFILALAATTSSMVSVRSLERSNRYAPVSLGYDRVRFLKPVFIGDTITIRYTIEALEPERSRSIARIEAVNQDEVLVMAAVHIMKWVENRG